jgi:hypothetical protein
MNSGRPVYLLDFSMAKPPEEWKFPRRTFLKASACNPVRARARAVRSSARQAPASGCH